MNSFKNKTTKIIMFAIVITIICGIFSGCIDNIPTETTLPDSTQQTNSPETNGETVIPVDSTEEPSTLPWDYTLPLVPLVEPEKIDVKFPDRLPDYTPEINIFPLLNDTNGKVHFIDRQYNLIGIPEETVGYYSCYSYETRNGEAILSTLQAYCIYNEDD